ncbi:Hsp20/alpha crystallin family protein [Bosea sp. UC22_33]|uniref:Hsp20/alpha crystallin family protein n=1 Tax=Bosea sp. UC22_33 TaxID=3350165 RepID=UPI00366E11D2
MKITDLVPWRGAGRHVAAGTDATDPVHTLQLEVDRAFDRFWRMVLSPFAPVGGLAQIQPVRVDVADNGKEITVTAELPGLSDADIELSVGNGQLTIRGEKKSEREADENGVLVKERVYGTIERAVPLPVGIDAGAAKASFDNGVLTIVIAKSEEAQAETRRIPVQAG